MNARARGETEQRLCAVAAWHEAPFFSERERAALLLTDAITLLADSHVIRRASTPRRALLRRGAHPADLGDHGRQRLEPRRGQYAHVSRRIPARMRRSTLEYERELAPIPGHPARPVVDREPPEQRTEPRLATHPAIAASRARIVAAADEARRRLERDLHDGAQQRLVSATVTLGQAQGKARGTPAERLVTEALEELRQALAELRDLARGLHPAVLSERGLTAALESLAARSPVPVELRAPRERAAPDAEAAIYFTVAEALTNIAKHAQATIASVQVDVQGAELVAQVSDDGVGDAAPTPTSGLGGLADRVEALGGELTVDSPAGEGTMLRARVPSQPLPSPSSEGARAPLVDHEPEPWQ
jgi:signal transduction histidine kinase